jgi:tetratricopeptide (TPR) repeat protein
VTPPGGRNDGDDGGVYDAPFVQREIVALVLLSALAVAAFFVTRAAAAANSHLRLQDASAWYARGERAANAAEPDAAIHALQRASGIDRDNLEYRLALARALAADHQESAARQLLLGVREHTPEDPQVNLQLARLEARRGDTTAAQKYYRDALYGAWKAEDAEPRRRARTEFVRYLLDHGEQKRAVSELIVLSGNLPDDAAAQTAAARLFLQAGEARQALELLEHVLTRDPDNRAAAAGAGEAAFALQDYTRAVRYLRVAAGDDQLADLRAIAELVLADDPLRPRLSSAARWQRVAAGINYARQRLNECTPTTGSRDASLTSLRTEAAVLEPSLTRRALRDSPEIINDAVGLIVRIEHRAGTVCGPPTRQDRAWALIGRLHDLDTQ